MGEAFTPQSEKLDKAVVEVCERMKSERDKARVTFYYLLAEKFDKLSAFACGRLAERLNAVTPRLISGVERAVGGPDQRIDGPSMLRKFGNADR